MSEKQASGGKVAGSIIITTGTPFFTAQPIGLCVTEKLPGVIVCNCDQGSPENRVLLSLSKYKLNKERQRLQHPVWLTADIYCEL